MDYQTVLKESDKLLDDVIAWTVRQSKISISLLERYFHIGYLRAASLLQSMEALKVIEKTEDGKERRIIMSEEEYRIMKTGIDTIGNARIVTKESDSELLGKMYRFVKKQRDVGSCRSNNNRIKIIGNFALETAPNHYKFYYVYNGKIYGTYVDFCPRINDFNTIVEFNTIGCNQVASQRELSILRQAISA